MAAHRMAAAWYAHCTGLLTRLGRCLLGCTRNLDSATCTLCQGHAAASRGGGKRSHLSSHSIGSLDGRLCRGCLLRSPGRLASRPHGSGGASSGGGHPGCLGRNVSRRYGLGGRVCARRRAGNHQGSLRLLGCSGRLPLRCGHALCRLASSPCCGGGGARSLRSRLCACMSVEGAQGRRDRSLQAERHR